MDRHEPRPREHHNLPSSPTNFDIFEDASPQRLPQRCGGAALANNLVDELVLSDGDANPSRKREYTIHGENNNAVDRGSKRRRDATWPNKKNTGEKTPNFSKPSSLSKRAGGGTPARPSKFLEATMHDRPSDRPPSLFVRNFNAHLETASVDDMMEDYVRMSNKPLPRRPGSRSPEKRSPQKYSPVKRSPDKSQTPTPDANSSNFNTELPAALHNTVQPKQSGGVFRFGKSMASSFNPVNLWQKVSTTWRETKGDLINESKAKDKDKEKWEWQQRQARAEEAYANIQQTVLLGVQGSKPIANDVKVYKAGYHMTAPVRQRDSGIMTSSDSGSSSVDTTLRPAAEHKPTFDLTSARPSMFHRRTPSFQASSQRDPSEDSESPRKGFMHIRAPSISDLKKVASVGHLRVRSASASRSPEKEARLDSDYQGLRHSPSKKDMAKQAKLSRRVSDLEMKLNAARVELHTALSQAPDAFLPASTKPPSHQGSRQGTGTWNRTFSPVLPTLISESNLLLAFTDGGGVADERRSPEPDAKVVSALIRPEDQVDAHTFSGHGLYSQPNASLSTPSALLVKTEDVDVAAFAKPTSELPIEMAFPLPPTLPAPPFEPAKKMAKKAGAKKRKSKELDGAYRPDKDTAGTDSEREATKSKTLKATRGSDAHGSPKEKASPKSKTSPKNKIPRKSVGSVVTVKTPDVTAKPQQPPKHTSVIPDDTEPSPQLTLETVQEETATVSTIDTENKHSMASNGSTNINRGRRSMSPPPSSTHFKSSPERKSRSSSEKARQWSSPDDPVSVRPGEGNVPPMPELNPGDVLAAEKDDFEWPEDVF